MKFKKVEIIFFGVSSAREKNKKALLAGYKCRTWQ